MAGNELLGLSLTISNPTPGHAVQMTELDKANEDAERLAAEYAWWDKAQDKYFCIHCGVEIIPEMINETRHTENCAVTNHHRRMGWFAEVVSNEQAGDAQKNTPWYRARFRDDGV